ncbi:MAG TPA: hypothetical protein PKM32_02980, partial [Planctomycetota bacterium]|nr:hypothetical protein [Planctomycetota bacterium]
KTEEIDKESAQTETSKAEEIDEESAQTEISKTEEIEEESAQTEISKTEEIDKESAQTETSKTEEIKEESTQTETSKTEEIKEESAQTETSKTEEIDKESAQTETSKAEEIEEESAQTETSKTEEIKEEFAQTETSKAEKPEISKAEQTKKEIEDQPEEQTEEEKDLENFRCDGYQINIAEEVANFEIHSILFHSHYLQVKDLFENILYNFDFHNIRRISIANTPVYGCFIVNIIGLYFVILLIYLILGNSILGQNIAIGVATVGMIVLWFVKNINEYIVKFNYEEQPMAFRLILSRSKMRKFLKILEYIKNKYNLEFMVEFLEGKFSDLSS